MRRIRFGLGGLFLLWVIGVAIWAAVALAQIARGDTLAPASAPPASLALFDVAGRRVGADEIRALDPGLHHVPNAKELSPGVDWLVLDQQGIESKSRVVVLR